MTKKDYILIARCINEAAKELDRNNRRDPIDLWEENQFAIAIGVEFCSELEADNHLFDKERFLEACKNGC